MTTTGKILPAALLLCGVFCCAAVRGEESRPERRIEFSGARSPVPGNVETVVPAGSCAVVRFAGKELSALLSRRLGREVPVRREPTRGWCSIILGVNDFSCAVGISEKGFCRDAFIIRRIGDRIFIAGRDDLAADPEKALKGSKAAQYFERGTLFGVYDFLERFAGIRFYFPGKYGTFIPEGKLTLPEKIDIFDRPDFEIRKLNMESGSWFETPGRSVRPRASGYPSFPGQRHPEKNLAGFRLRAQTLLLPNSHGLAKLELLRRFARNHPEYFVLDKQGRRVVDSGSGHPGHLCFSSGVKKEIYLDAKAFLSGKPASERGIGKWDPHGQYNGVIDLQPQDGFVFCRCEKCRDIMGSRKNASEAVWNFTADIAEQLMREGVPGTVQMMAYYPYTDVPKRELPRNMLIQVAVNGPWMFGLNPHQDELVKAWKRKNKGKVMLWNYCGKWGNGLLPEIPCSTPRRIGAYYRSIAPHISGAYMLCDGDHYIFFAMNQYVFSKVAWDNRTDVDALLDEYYRLMFGPAAGEMKTFFDRLETLWLRANGTLAETALGPLIAPPSEYDLFEKFYTRAEIARLTGLLDGAERKAAKDGPVSARIRFMRWNFLDRLAKVAAEYRTRNDTVGGFTVPGVLLAPGESPRWETIAPLHLQRSDAQAAPDLTTVRTALRKDRLFIRFFCREPEMENVSASPEDAPADIWNRNNVELFLDPAGNRKEYFQIVVSSAGVLLTQKGTPVGAVKRLAPVKIEGLGFHVKKGKDFWTCDLSIPVASLPGFRDRLVCNFNRSQIGKNGRKLYSWSPFTGRNNHAVLKYGTIGFGAVPVENLVRDGDFSLNFRKDNIFGAWSGGKQAESRVGYDPVSFIRGSRSLRMAIKPGGDWLSVGSGVKLAAGKRYRLSYYVKLDNVVPSDQNGGVSVGLWTGRNRWFPKKRLTGTTSWVRQSSEFTVEEKDAGSARLNLFMYRCTGAANFDALVLEEVKNSGKRNIREK